MFFSFPGMMYNEITASSLVKVNMQGEVVEEGTTNFGVNQVQPMIKDTSTCSTLKLVN